MHLLVSEFGECIDDDTEHDVETDGGDQDEECHIQQQSPASNVEWRTLCVALNIKRNDLKYKITSHVKREVCTQNNISKS